MARIRAVRLLQACTVIGTVLRASPEMNITRVTRKARVTVAQSGLGVAQSIPRALLRARPHVAAGTRISRGTGAFASDHALTLPRAPVRASVLACSSTVPFVAFDTLRLSIFV